MKRQAISITSDEEGRHHGTLDKLNILLNDGWRVENTIPFPRSCHCNATYCKICKTNNITYSL